MNTNATNQNSLFYEVDPKFAEMINLSKNKSDKFISNQKDITQRFISYGIHHQLITDENKQFRIDQIPYLYNKIRLPVFSPNNLFKHL